MPYRNLPNIAFAWKSTRGSAGLNNKQQSKRLMDLEY